MRIRKYRSVSLSFGLIEKVENHIAKNSDYRSIADFVNEATRLQLHQLESNQEQKHD